MFKFSSTNSSDANSILKNAKGRKKNFLKKKKKKVDRSVSWSETFETYDERCPQSFDGYEDQSCSRDGIEVPEDDYQSVISASDYSQVGHSEKSTKSPIKISSVFTPVEIPAKPKSTDTHSDDDASLIEDMDDYYDGSVICKAASDDTRSVGSYEKMDEFRRQRNVDGNLAHLGLVMPSFGEVLTVFGVNKLADESFDDDVSESSNTSEKIAALREANKRRNKAAGITESTKEAGKGTSSSAPKEKKSKDSRSAPTSSTETKVKGKKEKITQSAPTETKKKRMKAKSTAELNVAIQQLGINSTESTNSGIQVRGSGSDDVIEPLISDEVSESGNKIGEAGKNKKKYSIASLKNNRQEDEGKQAALWAQQQIKEESDQADLASLWAQQEKDKAETAVVQADLAQLWDQQEKLKAETAAVEAVEVNQSTYIEVKQSSSASTDGGSDSSGRKGKGNSSKLKSLKNKLSFRRKKSAMLSDRELEFAYAQQQQQPLGDIYFLRKEFGDEVGSAGGVGQKGLTIHSGNKVKLERASVPQGTNQNIKGGYSKAQGEGKILSNASRKMSDAPTTAKREIAPLKTDEEPTATKMGREVKTEEQALVDQQPAMEKQEKETATVAYPQTPSMHDQLYETILNAESFDSVSTTEDILYELEQIEEVAQKMFETYSVNGNV